MTDEATRLSDDALINERLSNIIHGYSWMAEGRGPYAYNDGRYDDEVMSVFTRLLEILPGGRWYPVQSWLDHVDSLEAQLKASNNEVVRLREALGPVAAAFIPKGARAVSVGQLKGMKAIARAALNPEANAEPGQET